jgi:hypothetical protein
MPDGNDAAAEAEFDIFQTHTFSFFFFIFRVFDAPVEFLFPCDDWLQRARAERAAELRVPRLLEPSTRENFSGLSFRALLKFVVCIAVCDLSISICACIYFLFEGFIFLLPERLAGMC